MISNRTDHKVKRMKILMLIYTLVFLSSCMAGKKINPPDVVSYVDLKKYTGTWYEISSYPNRFQKGCVGTRATYSLRTDGNIDVLNECYDGSFSGRLKSARGVAKVVDSSTNAKLKVSFFLPFYGDYWIIDLGENYDYAVVSNPERKYLWILSRSKFLDEELYLQILKKLEQKGFDINKLEKTPQK